MSNIPKTRVRRTVNRDIVAAFFGLAGHLWEVTLDGVRIGTFVNQPAALTYAHQRAVEAQRQHVEKLEHDAYHARRAAENAAGKRHSEFMDPMGRIWALAA